MHGNGLLAALLKRRATAILRARCEKGATDSRRFRNAWPDLESVRRLLSRFERESFWSVSMTVRPSRCRRAGAGQLDVSLHCWSWATGRAEERFFLFIDIGLRHGSSSVSLSAPSSGYVGHAHGGDAPDLLGVLPHRTVAREVTHPCRVQDRLLSPGRAIVIGAGDLLLAVHIRLIVGEDQIAIALLEKGVRDGGEQPRVVGTEGARPDHVEGSAKLGIFVIVRPGSVPGGARLDLVRRQTEDEDVVAAHGIPDLDVGPIQGADGERPVEGELHVARARGLRPCGGDLLRQFGG